MGTCSQFQRFGLWFMIRVWVRQLWRWAWCSRLKKQHAKLLDEWWQGEIRLNTTAVKAKEIFEAGVIFQPYVLLQCTNAEVLNVWQERRKLKTKIAELKKKIEDNNV